MFVLELERFFPEQLLSLKYGRDFPAGPAGAGRHLWKDKTSEKRHALTIQEA
jgi:hypothetical protein